MELDELAMFKESLSVKRDLVKLVTRDLPAFPIKEGALERAFAITALFEGKGYSQTTGDFDSQGLSWGFLQWCLGQGSLQPVLMELYTIIPDQMRDCLREICDDVLRVCKGALPWRTLSMKINKNYSKNKLKDPYQAYFERLGSLPEAQALQRQKAGVVARKAAGYCSQYGWKSERAFCLAFDIVTQNGSIGVTKFGDAPRYYRSNITTEMTEYQKLALMARAISKKCNPKWAHVVLARKMCIANSHGIVYGGNIDLVKRFGLTDGPWASEDVPAPRDVIQPETTELTEPQQFDDAHAPEGTQQS